MTAAKEPGMGRIRGFGVLMLGVVALAIYLPTVKQEEDYLRRMHGEAFDEYWRRVPGIVPRVRAAFSGQEAIPCPTQLHRSEFAWGRVFSNGEHKTWVAFAALVGLLWVRGRV